MSPTLTAAPGNSSLHTPAHASTRERILEYLEENRTASVVILSRAWNLTRADIRYHINSLLNEGIIEQIPRDPNLPMPRGRPEQIYRLAATSIPDNFPALCAVLLDALLCPLPIEECETALRGLAGRLAGSFVSVTNLTPRLNQAMTFLSQQGYRSRWEAHARGPRVLLRSCPYAQILSTHPELCLFDRFLIEHLVRIPLRQTAQINPTGKKPAACIFASGMES
jgi:predicted ArsR family transcriptional regulator